MSTPRTPLAPPAALDPIAARRREHHDHHPRGRCSGRLQAGSRRGLQTRPRGRPRTPAEPRRSDLPGPHNRLGFAYQVAFVACGGFVDSGICASLQKKPTDPRPPPCHPSKTAAGPHASSIRRNCSPEVSSDHHLECSRYVHAEDTASSTRSSRSDSCATSRAPRPPPPGTMLWTAAGRFPPRTTDTAPRTPADARGATPKRQLPYQVAFVACGGFVDRHMCLPSGSLRIRGRRPVTSVTARSACFEHPQKLLSGGFLRPRWNAPPTASSTLDPIAARRRAPRPPPPGTMLLQAGSPPRTTGCTAGADLARSFRGADADEPVGFRVPGRLRRASSRPLCLPSEEADPRPRRCHTQPPVRMLRASAETLSGARFHHVHHVVTASSTRSSRSDSCVVARRPPPPVDDALCRQPAADTDTAPLDARGTPAEPRRSESPHNRLGFAYQVAFVACGGFVDSGICASLQKKPTDPRPPPCHPSKTAAGPHASSVRRNCSPEVSSDHHLECHAECPRGPPQPVGFRATRSPSLRVGLRSIQAYVPPFRRSLRIR